MLETLSSKEQNQYPPNLRPIHTAGKKQKPMLQSSLTDAMQISHHNSKGVVQARNRRRFRRIISI